MEKREDLRKNDLQDVIKEDKNNNIHPRNRFFIYLFRCAQYVHKRGKIWKLLDFLLRAIIKLTINRINHYPLECDIGKGICLPHNIGIVIAGNAKIGEYVTIFQQVTIGVDGIGKSENAPQIGNHVIIGAGAKIIGSVKIGNYVVIGANAVVTKDVPDNKTVVGYNRIL